MKKEFKRLLEVKITNALKTIGCVLITGPKQAGKTFLAKKLSQSQFYVQEAGVKNQTLLEIKKDNPIFTGAKPRLIDEWQIVPQIWDKVRFLIDQSDDPLGLFILTGSTRADFKQVFHSGAGRILTIPIHTLSFAEILANQNQIKLSELFEKKDNVDPNIICEVGFEWTVKQLLNGGWPYALAHEISSENLLKTYLDALILLDQQATQKFHLNKIWLEQILISLARLNGTQIKLTTILKDLKPQIDSRTLNKYLNHIKNQYLIFDLDPWPLALGNFRSKTLIRSTSKTYWSDPSIGLYLLKIKNVDHLYTDLKTLGIYFENQVIKDLMVYATALNGQLYFYRDSNGFEIDAIMELSDGKWAAFEIKLSQINFDQAAQNLLRFEKRILEQKIKAKPAAFLMIISAQNNAYQRSDGIYVVAHTCLGV